MTRRVQFEGAASEIIDDVAMLNHTNDAPTALEEAVAQSNALREKIEFKRSKNLHNNNINSNNDQNSLNGKQHARNQHSS